MKNKLIKIPANHSFSRRVIAIDTLTTKTTNKLSICGKSCAIPNPCRKAANVTGKMSPPVHPVPKHKSQNKNFIRDKINNITTGVLIPSLATVCKLC